MPARGRLGLGPLEPDHQQSVFNRTVAVRDRGFERQAPVDDLDFERDRRKLGHASLANFEELVDPVDAPIRFRATKLRSKSIDSNRALCRIAVSCKETVLPTSSARTA